MSNKLFSNSPNEGRISLARRLMLHGVIAAFLAGFLGFQTGVHARDKNAEAFMSAVLGDANAAMRETDSDAMLAGVEVLVDRHVDIRRSARFTLGQYARKLTPEQADRFYPLFRAYATYIYRGILEDFAGEQLSVTGSIARSKRDVIVNSKITGTKPGDRHADTVVQWRLYKSPDGFKVVDAGADNVWLAIEQRSQFTSVIANNGGGEQGIDALINQLEERVGR